MVHGTTSLNFVKYRSYGVHGDTQKILLDILPLLFIYFHFYLFAQLFTHLFIHLLIYLFNCSLINYPFIYLFTHLFIYLCTHSLAPLFIRLF